MNDQERTPAPDGERLAAYLVGELDPSDQRALEARLARDPALRARLEAIRRTDSALAELDDVGPRPGFSARLRDSLAPEVSASIADGDTDELAARRRRRERPGGAPSWLAPLGAAAAGLALFTAIGVAVTSLGGDDTAESGADMALEATDGGAADGPGPVVVALDRTYTTDDVATIVDDDAFNQVLGTDPGTAETTSDRYLSAFSAARSGDDSAVADAGEDAPAEEDAEGDGDAATMQAPPLALQTRGDATGEDLEAVQRCLPQLFEEAGTIVPVYAEIATFEGEDAIVYGLVSEGGDSANLTRVEIWVVGRDDCQVRYFTQQDDP